MLLGSIIAFVGVVVGLVLGFTLGASGRANIRLSEELASLRREAEMRRRRPGPEVVN